MTNVFKRMKAAALTAMIMTVVAAAGVFGSIFTAIYIPMDQRRTSMLGRMAQRGASMSSYVIGIAVAALIVAIIVPIAFGQFFAVDTGSWDAQTILIWGIIPLVIILAIVLFFLNKADDQA